jgi:malate dehydrogenase (quinone)
MPELQRYDVALVGGGIMSATLGVLIKLANPKLKIVMYERLREVAAESSDAWNNAGTGHAALCELNYMPDSKDGTLPDPAKAISINEQFQVSRQFWAYCVEKGILDSPETFIRTVPHMTFVRGAKDVDYLRRRFEALKSQPLFAGMKFSEDPAEITKWIPLMMADRGNEQLAATWIEQGTDVDYGAITRQMVNWLTKNGMELQTSGEVKNLYQFKDGSWQIWLGSATDDFIAAERVFVGSGGYSLKLLQKSGIPEIQGYGTFPVSGHFLRTDDPELVKQHSAKVYSQAAVGAPPMSVPHLDTRIVDGKPSLLFGPFAGINPKFLKEGSVLDLPMSIRPKNLLPYISVALKNFGLLVYLIKEVSKSKKAKFEMLKEFVPSAKEKDWTYYEAGQRAQIIKPEGRLGSLQFGTEVVASSDGTISGLLGASPGASVSVSAMLDVLEILAPAEFESFTTGELSSSVQGHREGINEKPTIAKRLLSSSAKTLKLRK